MGNSASQTKAKAVRELFVGKKKEQYEFALILPEENISKILSASASVTVDKFEVLLGEVSFSGEACLNIVYSLEDGTMSNYKICEPFSGKFENLAFDPSILVNIIPNVLDITIEKGSNGGIKVELTLENTFEEINNQEIQIYQNEDENIFVKESEINITKQRSRNCKNFSQTTVFETKLPVGKILNVTSSATLKKAGALDGILIFEGETTTRLLYSTNEDRPLLVSLINKDDFREEIEDENATKEMFVEAFANVMGKDIEETIDKENKTVEINLPIKICYDLFESCSVRVTADAFSTKNYLNLTTEAFLATEIMGYETFDNKIDGSISLDEQALRIDKILAIDGAYLTSINETYADGEVIVEGLIHTNIIYLNDEEENVNAVAIEIPYSFKEKMGGENQLQVKVQNQILDIDAAVKRGRDVYIDGKIRSVVWLSKEVQNAVISGVEKGDEVEERDSAVEIYFAKEGQTFWDIAKELKIAEDFLREQNLDIIEPFIKEEKIVYYDQKVMEE